MKSLPEGQYSRWRFIAILVILLVISLVILGRLIWVSVIEHSFLLKRAVYQSIHYQTLPAIRGVIYDRNGVPLALSAPVDNIILDPYTLGKQSLNYWQRLANLPVVGMSLSQVQNLVQNRPHSRYFVAQRNIPPAEAAEVKALKIPGVYVEQKQQTFYPYGPATAQLIGFTNQQNQGQSGLELALNSKLKATQGREEVLRNALGQVLAVPAILKEPQDGQDVTLSIDSRIQSYAYIALKKAVTSTNAKSGSAVVLDPKTGEVLAAVTYPSFNPNDFSDRTGPQVRARALTDLFEPGSTIKVLTLAMALESGKYNPQSLIYTSPGYYFINGNRIHDDGDYGTLTLTGVLTKSSNVGISKIALSLNHRKVYDMFLKAGIGTNPGGNFPAEASGVIHPYNRVGTFEFATMTFGYAFSLSLTQLARIYAAIADHGVLHPISLLKLKKAPPGTRIMPAAVASQLIKMLRTVVATGGTGLFANIPAYNVVGKTGTSHQVGPHGFYRTHFNAVFVGMVPMENPRLVIAVRINDPQGHFNGFGGVSAAPVFSAIAQRSMNILNVKPTRTTINTILYENKRDLLRAIAGA